MVWCPRVPRPRARNVGKLELAVAAIERQHVTMSLGPGNLFALLSTSTVCWLERHAATQIEYLKAENHALRVKLGHRRILFTDAERQTLALWPRVSAQRP